jgi:hypothetical protein
MPNCHENSFGRRSELAARAHSRAKQAGGGNLPAEDPGGCSDGIRDGVKYWEIIAVSLSKAGWSWGCSQRLIVKGE